MHIRSLPRSRRSRNRRRNGRWVRCTILDRQWVAPNAVIGLYLLDEKRREVQRARDVRDEPIAFDARSTPYELERAVSGIGEGLYRLVARDRAGHILARRDFAAALWSAPDICERKYSPRTEIERLKAEVAEARQAAEDAAAERDEARAEVEALKAAAAERDEAIGALEVEIEQRGQQLERARRLYARMGTRPAAEVSPVPEPEKPSERRARKPIYRRPRRERTADRSPKQAGRSAGLDLETFDRACQIFTHHFTGQEPKARASGQARDEPDHDEPES